MIDNALSMNIMPAEEFSDWCKKCKNTLTDMGYMDNEVVNKAFICPKCGAVHMVLEYEERIEEKINKVLFDYVRCGSYDVPSNCIKKIEEILRMYADDFLIDKWESNGKEIYKVFWVKNGNPKEINVSTIKSL